MNKYTTEREIKEAIINKVPFKGSSVKGIKLENDYTVFRTN